LNCERTGDNPSAREFNVNNYLFASPFTTGMFFELHSFYSDK
jgi:hypothetical protein